MTVRNGRAGAREEGAALIVVVGFVAIIMVSVLAMVGRIVTEARAIEDNLTQVRAYWAAQGMSNYVLSRAMGSGACTTACAPGNPITVLQSYMNEISPAAIWLYPEVSRVYRIAMNPTVAADTATAPTWAYVNRITFAPCPGLLNGTVPSCPAPSITAGPLSVAVPSFSYPDALRSLLSTRPVEVRYCFTTSATTACGPGAKTLTAGKAFHFITSVHRPSR